MNTLRRLCRGRWLPLSLAVFALASPWRNSARAASEPIRGIVVHSSQEVSERYISTGPDGPVFHAPDGEDWLLLARPSAPTGSEGSAAFHPMSEAQVDAAIQGIRYPLTGYHFDVFILPFPARKVAGSSAANGCLFLAPGVRDYTPEEVHFVVDHEMGHLVQAALMPDDNTALWARYRALRGISDSTVYNSRAEHGKRPHEIFAEDFRFLFGDDASRYTGGIENGSIALPTQNPQVRALFIALSDGRPAAGALTGLRLAALPNPSRGPMDLSFTLVESSGASPGLSAGATHPVRVEVFSLDGRKVATPYSAELGPGSYSAHFDGRDDSGRKLPAGTWFVRLTAGGQIATRKVIFLP